METTSINLEHTINNINITAQIDNNLKTIWDGADHYLTVRYNPYDSSLHDKVKAYVIKDCFDEQDIHYFRKPKSLKKGTEILISSIVENLYGIYFRTYVNNIRFDIDPSFVSFIKPSWFKNYTQEHTNNTLTI